MTGLFEVVAEKLVELDEVRSVQFEPLGEALVEVGADRLGKGVVGGVAEEEVAESEPVLAEELRSIGPDQLLANERMRVGASPEHPRSASA